MNFRYDIRANVHIAKTGYMYKQIGVFPFIFEDDNEPFDKSIKDSIDYQIIFFNVLAYECQDIKNYLIEKIDETEEFK